MLSAVQLFVSKDVDLALAVIVRTEVAVPLPGTVMEVGLNEQVTTGFEVVHQKLTPALKTFAGVTAPLNVAEPSLVDRRARGSHRSGEISDLQMSVAV